MSIEPAGPGGDKIELQILVPKNDQKNIGESWKHTRLKPEQQYRIK